LQLAETSQSPAEIAECSALLGLANAWLGNLRRVESLLPRWLAAAHRCHDPYQLRHVTSWRAWSLLQLGRFEAAGRVLAEARPFVERLASPEPLATYYSILSNLNYQQGQYTRSEELAREAVAIFRSIGPQALIWYLGMLGIALAAQGKDAEAHENMAELELLIAGHPPGTMPTAEPLTYMAITAIQLADRTAAARIYPRLLAFQGQFHDFLIDRLLGQLAGLLSQWPEAARHLAAGQKMAEANGLLLEQIYVRDAWAALELDRGGPASRGRARAHLSEALRICEAAGIASEIARLQERLRGLPEAGKHAKLPAGLSPREAEVLRLVAVGKSNREIAERLVVSERTVANHMASIFNKLAVDNRAAASAFAVRHGLAD
jgi:DNA-binding CsgD family transcriptional regulator